MANHVIRFYARSAQPVWAFIDQSIESSDLVRRYGRGYSDPRLPGSPGGWYLTVVVETEGSAQVLRDWISARPDHSFEMKFWPDKDHSAGTKYGVQIDLTKKSPPRFFYHRSFIAKFLSAFRKWLNRWDG